MPAHAETTANAAIARYLHHLELELPRDAVVEIVANVATVNLETLVLVGTTANAVTARPPRRQLGAVLAALVGMHANALEENAERAANVEMDANAILAAHVEIHANAQEENAERAANVEITANAILAAHVEIHANALEENAEKAANVEITANAILDALVGLIANVLLLARLVVASKQGVLFYIQKLNGLIYKYSFSLNIIFLHDYFVCIRH